MSEPPPFVELAGVAKRFGRAVALRGIDLVVAPGEVVAVLGANGAGKTTLLRTIATLARPTRGRLRLFGLDPWRERTIVRARIGVVAHQPYLYPELTCRENLRFFATMFAAPADVPSIDAVLARVGLAARRDDRAASLSRGLLQRLSLARAIVHRPELLILDEPDTGLDAPGRAVLDNVIAEQAEAGGAVVFTSHAIDRALDIATRIVVLERGSLVLDQPATPGARAAAAAMLAGHATPAMNRSEAPYA